MPPHIGFYRVKQANFQSLSFGASFSQASRLAPRAARQGVSFWPSACHRKAAAKRASAAAVVVRFIRSVDLLPKAAISTEPFQGSVPYSEDSNKMSPSLSRRDLLHEI